MIVPLSQRIRNSNEVCARCEKDKNGKCEMPILLDMDKRTGKYHTAKLISFSRDGKECQLFTMSRDWWSNNVTKYDVLCPRCSERFWDCVEEFYCGHSFNTGEEDWRGVRVCRQCAEEVMEQNPEMTFRIRDVKRWYEEHKEEEE